MEGLQRKNAIRLTDEGTFLRHPQGAVVLGQQWTYGCVGRLYFSILRGALDETAMSALLRVMRVELASAGHVSLGDATGMTSITPGAFDMITRYTHENRVRLGRVIESQVLVRPAGMAGALVAGYYAVNPPLHPHAVSETRSVGLEHLGLSPSLLDEIDAHLEREPVLGQLQQHLAQNLGATSLARAARLLGLSARSLQRRLSVAGTSFVREATRARIERAVRLLTTSDKKLCAIAAEVGCASLASFSEMFSREVGMPPSQYRARSVGRAA